MKSQKNKPVIFWHSDPVKPDETLVLSGEYFSEDATVDISRQTSSGKESKKLKLTPVQISRNSLKVVIPADMELGAYVCHVTQKSGQSDDIVVNAPDSWWVQGDEGVGKCRQGGWLRLFGKCLAFDKEPTIQLKPEKGKVIELKVTEFSNYSVSAEVPANLAEGDYRVVISNNLGEKVVCQDVMKVLSAKASEQHIMNVLDFGADPTGKNDSTFAVVQATERLGAFGGGVVYFPHGRYRIDSILRSGSFIKTPLKIPAGVTFKGEGMDVVSLWWPDNEEPLPSLIEGANDFGIEDLSIYTQGRHSTIITGESNARINRVCIRVNCYYMTNNNGKAHHGRQFEDIDFAKDSMGAAFHIWGDNLSITNCDIYTSNICFDIKHCHGGIIANNKVRAKNFHFFSGCSEFIFENNEFSGNQLTTGGSNIALHFGASISQHIYYAKNKISHIYGGDHEALTLDGHGTAYLGKVKNVKGTSFELVGNVFPKSDAKGSMWDMNGTAVYILDGCGRGQYRWLECYDSKKIHIDRPWDAEPDNTSLIAIGGFNGRHIFHNNTMQDTGTAIQLYPPNAECIVAENKSIRVSNINSLSKLGKNKEHDFVRVEPSWYNQFLDNHIQVGNHWGGGCNEIDRWIGGESTMNIWGWQVYYYSIGGKDYDEFMTPEVTKDMLGEKSVRKLGIPLSLFQIVRRHRIDNNSSIRVRGAVSDVLIEGAHIAKAAKGIRVDYEINYDQPEDLGQLFDFDPETVDEKQLIPFLKPEGVLIRNNNFNHVKIPYSGTAIQEANIQE